MKPVTINFQQLTRPAKPNYYLACPSDQCNIQPDQQSPGFAVGVEQLKQAVEKIIQDASRYQLLNQTPLQHQYVQRSLIWRFPDYVTVRFYSLPHHNSSLALLSFAKYGYYDFGVNQKRVRGILKQLTDQLPVFQKN